MLAVLAALVLAALAPSPEPTNPFTLTPVSPSPIPLIGTTRSRQICTAVRRSVLPALEHAKSNDVHFSGARTSFFKYYVQNEGLGKDFILFKLDQTTLVAMKKNLDAYDTLLGDPALIARAYQSPDDARLVTDLKARATVLRAAQDLEYEVLSGLLETERMNRFRQPSETEQSMRVALGTDQLGQASGDEKVIEQYYDTFHGVAGLKGLASARAIDTDLETLQSISGKAAAALTQSADGALKRCSAR